MAARLLLLAAGAALAAAAAPTAYVAPATCAPCAPCGRAPARRATCLSALVVMNSFFSLPSLYVHCRYSGVAVDTTGKTVNLAQFAGNVRFL